MPAFGRVSGVSQELDPRAKVNGVWENISEGSVKVSGVWERFYTRFNASISPSVISGGGSGPGTFTASPAEISVLGAGPFRYLFSRTGGDSRLDVVGAKDVTTSATSLSRSVQGSIGVEFVTADFQCVVTDTSTGDFIVLSFSAQLDGTQV